MPGARAGEGGDADRGSVRVLLSYSHDSSDHSARVRRLADQLREHGVDAWIDQYEPNPPQGWPRWMREQLDRADFVLCVCTPTWARRFQGQEAPGVGKGVTFEGGLIDQDLYDAHGRNKKYIPIGFDASVTDAIPDVLRRFTFHVLAEADWADRERPSGGYLKLYRQLTGQPEATAPRLGAPLSLPKERLLLDPSLLLQLADALARSYVDENASRRLLIGLGINVRRGLTTGVPLTVFWCNALQALERQGKLPVLLDRIIESPGAPLELLEPAREAARQLASATQTEAERATSRLYRDLLTARNKGDLARVGIALEEAVRLHGDHTEFRELRWQLDQARRAYNTGSFGTLPPGSSPPGGARPDQGPASWKEKNLQTIGARKSLPIFLWLALGALGLAAVAGILWYLLT